jgi:hypothetical protein
MMKTNRAKSITSQAAGAMKIMAIGRMAGRVCPSDWDKRKTLFVSPFTEVTYKERFQDKRRGQESLDGCLLLASRLRQLLVNQAVTITASSA